MESSSWWGYSLPHPIAASASSYPNHDGFLSSQINLYAVWRFWLLYSLCLRKKSRCLCSLVQGNTSEFLQ